jgi:hypothetical protein
MLLSLPPRAQLREGSYPCLVSEYEYMQLCHHDSYACLVASQTPPSSYTAAELGWASMRRLACDSRPHSWTCRQHPRSPSQRELQCRQYEYHVSGARYILVIPSPPVCSRLQKGSYLLVHMCLSTSMASDCPRRTRGASNIAWSSCRKVPQGDRRAWR